MIFIIRRGKASCSRNNAFCPDSVVLKGKKTFTLIELLVVIAIIAILAAMLMPALQRARAMARTSDCIQHVKQLAQALSLYAEDFNGCFPKYYDNIYGVNRKDNWVFYTGFPCPTNGYFEPAKGALFSYAPSKGIFLCPEDVIGIGNSYSLNSLTSAAKQCRFNKSSATPLVLEEGSGKSSDDGYLAATNRVIRRHQNRSVIGFIDLHVENSELNDDDIEKALTY